MGRGRFYAKALLLLAAAATDLQTMLVNGAHPIHEILYAPGDSPSFRVSAFGAASRRMLAETTTYTGLYVSPSLKHDLLVTTAVQNTVCARILQRYLLSSKEMSIVHRPIVVGTVSAPAATPSLRMEVVGDKPLPLSMVDASMSELRSRCRALASRVVTEAPSAAPITAITELLAHMKEEISSRTRVFEFYSSAAVVILGPHDAIDRADPTATLSTFYSELQSMQSKYHIPCIVIRLGKINSRPVTNREFNAAIDWARARFPKTSDDDDSQITALALFGAHLPILDDTTNEEVQFVDSGDLLMNAEHVAAGVFNTSVFHYEFGIPVEETYVVVPNESRADLKKKPVEDESDILAMLSSRFPSIKLKKMNTVRCITKKQFEVKVGKIQNTMNPEPFSVKSVAFMEPFNDYCTGEFDYIRLVSDQASDLRRASVNIARYSAIEAQLRLDGLLGTSMPYLDEDDDLDDDQSSSPMFWSYGQNDRRILSPLRHATFVHLWRHTRFSAEFTRCAVTVWSPPTQCLNFRSFRFRRYRMEHSGPFPCTEDLVESSPCPMSPEMEVSIRSMDSIVDNHYDMWTWTLAALTMTVWGCFAAMVLWTFKKLATKRLSAKKSSSYYRRTTTT